MLLLAFKKVAEELMNKKRKEMLNEAEARKGDVSLEGPLQYGKRSESVFGKKELTFRRRNSLLVSDMTMMDLSRVQSLILRLSWGTGKTIRVGKT